MHQKSLHDCIHAAAHRHHFSPPEINFHISLSPFAPRAAREHKKRTRLPKWGIFPTNRARERERSINMSLLSLHSPSALHPSAAGLMDFAAMVKSRCRFLPCCSARNQSLPLPCAYFALALLTKSDFHFKAAPVLGFASAFEKKSARIVS
jgi:hypothetical protein